MDSNNEALSRTASPHANAAQQFNGADIIMAVMGVTGAGKSTLISKLIGDDYGAVPVVGHGLESETKLTDVYQFHHKVHGTIHLIDTPGFDDTHTSDAEVLREIAYVLSATYQTKVKLTGIIYLHRISDNRISGSVLRNLRMFKELCGEDAYKHVVLATSMWGKEDQEKALERERELVAEGGFWSTMKERGSSVMRWLGDSVSAHEIIEHLMLARSRHGAVSLKIQRQLVDEGKRLVNTSAGQEVNRELSELREKMENELRRIQEENKEAMTSKDIEWQQSLIEQRLLLEKQRLMAKQSQEALKVDFHRLLAETDEKYRIKMSRILKELRKAEETLAQKLSEEKDQAVKVLETQMSGAGAEPRALPQRPLAAPTYLSASDGYHFGKLPTYRWRSHGSTTSSGDSGYETILPVPDVNPDAWGGPTQHSSAIYHPELYQLESTLLVPKLTNEESVKEEPRDEYLPHYSPLEPIRVCKNDEDDAAAESEAEMKTHVTGSGNDPPTETSTPESSAFWLAEYSEDEDEKLDKDHPFMQLKALAAARVFEVFCRWKEYRLEQDIPCDGAGKSNAAPNQDKEKGEDSTTRKRTRADQSESSKDATDKSGSSSSQTASSKRRRTSDRKLTFACPYTKKDPMSHRDCYKYVLSRIRDVKQHLVRCHRNPVYCPRCMGTFETEEERDGHVRESSCPLRPPVKLEGITESQKRRLAKKSASNTSVEDQWFAVFDILFPGHDPRPQSPYIDSELLQDITLYQDFLTSSGPRILSDVLTRRGAVTWNLPNEERDLAAFQQTIFEEGLRAIFDQWVSRRSNNSQEPSGPSVLESANQDTRPSSSNSTERVVSISNDASGVAPLNMRLSLSGLGPSDTLAGSEALQEASSGQTPFDEELDGILNFEHEGINFQPGLDYDGPEEELMRLMLGTHESSSFQPGPG